jgi:hypothetical protein
MEKRQLQLVSNLYPNNLQWTSQNSAPIVLSHLVTSWTFFQSTVAATDTSADFIFHLMLIPVLSIPLQAIPLKMPSRNFNDVL